MKTRLTRSLIAAAAFALASWGVQAAECATPTVSGSTTTYYLDCTGGTATINGSNFTQFNPQSTGTGVLSSFVEIGGNTDQTAAYNTTVNNVLNNGSSDQFNHEITIGQIGFVDLGGGNLVMRFVLDVNQTGVSPKLHLDDVQIFLSNTANKSTTNIASLGSLVWGMDTAGDNRAVLDFSLNSGSGSGDIFLDIAQSRFNAALLSLFGVASLGDLTAAQMNGTFIYLYSAFGSPDYINNDGFEEWGYVKGGGYGEPPCTVNCNPQEVPEPAMLSLVGLAMLAAVGVTRRRRRT